MWGSVVMAGHQVLHYKVKSTPTVDPQKMPASVPEGLEGVSVSTARLQRRRGALVIYNPGSPGGDNKVLQPRYGEFSSHIANENTSAHL